MRAITGTDISEFFKSGADLLVLTAAGEFVGIDAGEVEQQHEGAYAFVLLEDGGEVQILLERSAIVGGDWFPDALDDAGALVPAVADEMAELITADGILPGRVAKAQAATEAWEAAEQEANRLALARAVAVTEVTAFAGSQSAGARLLDLDQSTVNKLVKKAKASAAGQARA
ncbi:hypothetical protein AB0A71_38975 [Kitasatospora aureofaciens]|uniref:hypothetical protein n=1 Tax=Kitasatospora aureofaciens TaxID=1894 RepID=UPI0033DA14C0